MRVGYARISSKGQNMDRQLDVLVSVGCDVVHEERASGKSIRNRPVLERVLSSLNAGDVLVVAEWDRCTRSLYDGVDLIRRVYELGASIEILDKPHLGLDTAIGRAIVALLSGLAEDERLRIRRRTEMGRVAAKVRGVVFGRPEKLSGYQIDCAREMRCGGKSYREIGRVLGVHHSTVSSMLEVA